MQVNPASSSRPIISDIHAGVAAARAAAAAIAFALALAAAPPPVLAAVADDGGDAPAAEGGDELASPATAADAAAPSLPAAADCVFVVPKSARRGQLRDRGRSGRKKITDSRITERFIRQRMLLFFCATNAASVVLTLGFCLHNTRGTTAIESIAPRRSW